MNYLNTITDFPKDELELRFQNGEIIISRFGEEVDSEIINSIRVFMEEYSEVIGIRRILKCSIYNDKDKIIHDDCITFADLEFNYADGNADKDVAENVANEYHVPLGIIDIEP